MPRSHVLWSTALAVLALVSAPSAAVRADELHVPSQFPTIQAAIDATELGDTVVVAPGTYHEAFDLIGRVITVRSSGGADATVLDGTGLGVPIVLAQSGETLATVVEGFTLANGEGGLLPNCVANKPVGGAAYVSASGLTFRDCRFFHNGHNLDIAIGGAIMVYRNGSLAVHGCVFEENGGTMEESELVCARGGAIGICNAPFSSIRITDCTFVGNQGSHGGGVFCDEAGELTVSGSVFAGNRSSHGGGIRVETQTVAAIINCEFSGNEASFGAGLNASAGVETTAGVVLVDACEFTDNHAGFGGGMFGHAFNGTGVPVDPAPRMTLTNSRFSGNTAQPCCNTGIYVSPCFRDGATQGTHYGGGADLREIDGCEVRVGNCLFVGNSGRNAGGLHVSTCGEPDFDLPGGTIDVASSTFVDNDGIGVHARVGRSGTIIVSNVISVGQDAGENIVTFLKDPVDGEAVVEVRYSNIAGGFPGDGNIDAAPDFVDGPAGDYRLAAGSAGIDAGDNGTVAGWLLADLAGAPRFVDDPGTVDTGLGEAPLVDMGAYEFQGADCAADLNGDGQLNLFDFLAFQAAFGNEEPAADLAPPIGVFNLFDFLAFQTAFGNGC